MQLRILPLVATALILAFSLSPLPATAGGLGLRVPVTGLKTALRDNSDLAVMPVSPNGKEDAEPLLLKAMPLHTGTTWIVDDQGRHALPDSPQRAFIGYRNGQRVGLRFDAKGELAFGLLVQNGNNYRLRVGRRSKSGLMLNAEAIADAPPEAAQCAIPGSHFEQAEQAPADKPSLPPLVNLMQPEDIRAFQKTTTPTRQAVVAVDTDHTFLLERFNNNTGAAQTWMDDLFMALNVIYERDLQLHLIRGDTILRTTSAGDPYPALNPGALLPQFGKYWFENYSSGANAIPRNFATIFSGKLSNPGAGSGVAWVDIYCNTGKQQSGGVIAGSYSANMLPTNPALPVTVSAELIGHELGHNFGAKHTHCTDTNSSPTVFEPIDRCESGEGTDCYSGVESCPADFNGHGTIMSYCSSLEVNNVSICGARLLQFHPVHISLLEQRMAANTPSCLAAFVPPTEPPFFADGFEDP